MKTSAKLGAAAALGLIVVLTPVPASADSVIELAPMPTTGRSGVPTAINDHDVVVGYGNAGKGIHAVRWNTRYYVTDLGALPGDASSVANAINNHNVVVGDSSGGDGQRAVRWAKDGAITALPRPADAKYCTATDINDHGVIVGRCGPTSTSTVTGQAVRWDTDGTVTVLAPLPGGTSAHASGVNAEGRIVGWSTSADGGLDAVTWYGTGPTALASLPGSALSRATGINDNGMIVGYARILGGVDRAVYWNADGQVTELGGFPDAHDQRGMARAVNEGGIVVGDATSSTEKYVPAFWEFGPAVALPYQSVPGAINSAVAINNSNVMVGRSGNKAVQWRI